MGFNSASKGLIVQYIMYRTVHLLVLKEFVNPFTTHGMNNIEI